MERKGVDIEDKIVESNTSFILKDTCGLKDFNSLKCDAYIETDVFNKTVKGFLRFEKFDKSSCFESYVGLIAYEELDTCISSLIFIKDKILSSNPYKDREASYKTERNVNFSAYTNNGQWISYIKIDGKYESIEHFNSDNIDDLIDIMKQAKQLIRNFYLSQI